MADKFSMSVEDNVFYAKRNIVDSIWKEARLEGIGVTFPETKEIFEGRAVSGLSVDSTIAINNLKHGWQFILDTLDAPVTLQYVRQVNGIVGQGIVVGSGELRNFDVGIGGTSWKPDMPDFDSAKEMVEGVSSMPRGQARAIEMFCALCRAQLFPDGNKRTAQLVANKMLIADGAGIMAVPVEEKPRFEELLIEFYETADGARLQSFLVERALDGIERRGVVSQGRAKPVDAPRETSSARPAPDALSGQGAASLARDRA